MRINLTLQSPHGSAVLGPDYCENNSLGGSETAVIKMAQALQELGAKVTISTKPSEMPAAPPDVFVMSRQWGFFDKSAGPGRVNYLWCQDDVDQPLPRRPARTGCGGARVWELRWADHDFPLPGRALDRVIGDAAREDFPLRQWH